MVDGTTGARSWDLPAPVTVTDIYLAALLDAVLALRDATERLAAQLEPQQPAPRRRTTTKE